MDQCYKKCISSFNEQELTKGEGVCVDRCVSKYMEMQTKMQIRLSSIGISIHTSSFLTLHRTTSGGSTTVSWHSSTTMIGWRLETGGHKARYRHLTLGLYSLDRSK